jgi:hypothetical protein
MIKPQGNRIVLQCPDCGARAGVNAGKTRCSQPGHPPMVPAWSSTGQELTAKECQEQKLFNGGAKNT